MEDLTIEIDQCGTTRQTDRFEQKDAIYATTFDNMQQSWDPLQ